MGFQSKTYSLSDEVVAAIEVARARGLTPNKFFLHLLAFEQSMTTEPEDLRIDATARREPLPRAPRQKGDKTR